MRLLALGCVIGSLVGCGADDSGPSGGKSGVAEFGGGSEPTFTLIGTQSDGLNVPRGLAFHPDRPNELWTVNRALDGTVLFFDAGLPSQQTETIIDAFGDHFMEEVSSIAFGDNGTFGTCQESANTYNHQTPGNDFMGPALWTADLDIYGVYGQDLAGDKLGSHIDMLHGSPYCMGIAHETANQYWVFDGANGHVVYYDFKDDHGPGNDDHSDGVIRRYPEAELTRVSGVPGGMVIDDATGWLYVADTGGQRILRLDIHSGSKARNLPLVNEMLAEYSEYTEATVETFVSSGLAAPSGVAIHAGKLFVSDNANGTIHAYDLDNGKELGTLATGARGIMGITVGPDGRLWFVDGRANKVVRVDP